MEARVYVVCDDKGMQDLLAALVNDAVVDAKRRGALRETSVVVSSGATPMEHAQIKLLWAKADFVREKIARLQVTK